jgi:hypothetical protein
MRLAAAPQKVSVKPSLFGASSGLGLAMAEEYLKLEMTFARNRAQRLVNRSARSRQQGRWPARHRGCRHYDPAQGTVMRQRLGSERFELQPINAGVKNDDQETIADVSTKSSPKCW